jgi:hypothetical protein
LKIFRRYIPHRIEVLINCNNMTCKLQVIQKLHRRIFIISDMNFSGSVHFQTTRGVISKCLPLVLSDVSFTHYGALQYYGNFSHCNEVRATKQVSNISMMADGVRVTWTRRKKIHKTISNQFHEQASDVNRRIRWKIHGWKFKSL